MYRSHKSKQVFAVACLTVACRGEPVGPPITLDSIASGGVIYNVASAPEVETGGVSTRDSSSFGMGGTTSEPTLGGSSGAWNTDTMAAVGRGSGTGGTVNASGGATEPKTAGGSVPSSETSVAAGGSADATGGLVTSTSPTASAGALGSGSVPTSEGAASGGTSSGSGCGTSIDACAAVWMGVIDATLLAHDETEPDTPPDDAGAVRPPRNVPLSCDASSCASWMLIVNGSLLEELEDDAGTSTVGG